MLNACSRKAFDLARKTRDEKDRLYTRIQYIYIYIYTFELIEDFSEVKRKLRDNSPRHPVLYGCERARCSGSFVIALVAVPVSSLRYTQRVSIRSAAQCYLL